MAADNQTKSMHITAPDLEIDEDAQTAVFKTRWHLTAGGLVVDVPAGYKSDGASVPRWLWWLCGCRTARPRVYAAAVHDWLYDYGQCTRLQADMVFVWLGLAFGCFWLDVLIQLVCVRAFGWRHFRKPSSSQASQN